MTRTERATFPRALIRDRSESKSGLDKSLRKGGGGQHNWGRIANERGLEDAAFEDELQQAFTAEDRRDSLEKDPSERRSNSVREEEMPLARDFRKNAFKGQDIDLSAIARTSAAVSTSPTTDVAIPLV